MGYRDPEKNRERARAYRTENPDRVRENNRAYRDANPEKVREWDRAFRETGRKREWDRAYRERLTGSRHGKWSAAEVLILMDETLTLVQRSAILDRGYVSCRDKISDLRRKGLMPRSAK